jgi:hypothetical protein
LVEIPGGEPARSTVRVDGRKAYADAFIFGPDGKPAVEATAMFIMPLR